MRRPCGLLFERRIEWLSYSPPRPSYSCISFSRPLFIHAALHAVLFMLCTQRVSSASTFHAAAGGADPPSAKKMKQDQQRKKIGIAFRQQSRPQNARHRCYFLPTRKWTLPFLRAVRARLGPYCQQRHCHTRREQRLCVNIFYQTATGREN